MSMRAPPAIPALRRGITRSTGARKLAIVFALLLACTVVLRMPAFFVAVFNSDETFLATQAQVIEEGGNLYEEAADRKPPLVPYLYAATFAAFGTTALWTVRIVAMLAVALTGLLLFVEARRRYGERAGWIAGLLFVGAMVAFAPQDGQAANFEVFMLPAMTAAVLLARRGRGVGAGAMVAVATMAKQTGAATLLPVLWLLARARGKRGLAEAGVGFTVPTVLIALAVGPAQLVYWAVLGNGSYLGLATASALVLGMFAVMTFTWVACNLPLLWRIPRAWRDRALEAADGERDTDLWLWVLSAALSVAVGLRFFGHYYIQLVPPLALLAAGALARGPARAARATVVVSIVCGLGFSAAGYFMNPFSNDPSYEEVSAYLAEHSHEHDRILVWGSAPEIYWASGLLPATRFITTNTFLAGNHPGRTATTVAPADTDPQMWDYFYGDFLADPPRYIIDTSPAKVRGAQHSPISDFPTLDAIVDRHYRHVRSIDGIAVYERQTRGHGVDR